MNGLVKLLSAALVLGVLCGCGRSNHGADTKPPSKHQHIPPHGGTPVVLGHEEYHLELVLDAATGMMQVYVMDGELENFVRIASAGFEIAIKQPAGEPELSFHPVPNRATGETTGDTSLFAAQAGWLKSARTFDAELKQININGAVYQNVAFNFPKGNDTDEDDGK